MKQEEVQCLSALHYGWTGRCRMYSTDDKPTIRQVTSPARVTYLVTVLLMALQRGAFASDNYKSFFVRATNLMKHHQIHEAIPLFEKAIKLQPKSAEAHTNLGWAFYQLGNVDEAYKQTKKAVKLDPKSTEAHQYLALVYLAKNMPSEAVAEMKLLRKRNPKHKCHCPLDTLLK